MDNEVSAKLIVVLGISKLLVLKFTELLKYKHNINSVYPFSNILLVIYYYAVRIISNKIFRVGVTVLQLNNSDVKLLHLSVFCF